MQTIGVKGPQARGNDGTFRYRNLYQEPDNTPNSHSKANGTHAEGLESEDRMGNSEGEGSLLGVYFS